MDGSQKLPQRLLGTIRDRLKRGPPFGRLALGVAAWMRYVTGVDEKGGAIDVRDPLAGAPPRDRKRGRPFGRAAGAGAGQCRGGLWKRSRRRSAFPGGGDGEA